ncbi:hypothetical protein QFC22_005580 [Naganishia vaughanmartiniae]|uniref:Uncharacterized protein n=1 Tax=Naganishia vaughanmartiniae TaxID=1424756 RepID=A0ACC2WU92_9TREE|nr:hypothetical protein QFC22_005580 [Naganishia vaughanmartiniae]
MPSTNNFNSFQLSLSQITDHLNDRFETLNNTAPTPTRSDIDSALLALPSELPSAGLGTKETVDHLLGDITKGFLTGHAGSRFFGLVTGGVTPASQLADILGTSYDESLQINFPEASMAVALEQKALDMVLDLLHIPVDMFQGRSVTTGATASNIMGLACARDALLLNAKHLSEGYTIAEHGFPPPIPTHITSTNSSPSYIPAIKIITVKPHGSVLKAAAITGIGRINVVDLPKANHNDGDADPWGLAFDLHELENELSAAQRVGQGVVVVVTLGEVNTVRWNARVVDQSIDPTFLYTPRKFRIEGS